MIIITDEINKALRKRHEANEHGTDISISGLGKCLRQLIMVERGYSKKPEWIAFDDRQIGVFQCGFQFEYFVLDLIDNLKVARQIPAEYRGVKGTADFIVKDTPRNILIDIKSCNSKKFDYLEGTPDESYAMQLSAYYFSLKDKYNLSPIIRLFYIDKDTLRKHEIGFNAENYKDKVDKKIDNIEIARKSSELPLELAPDETGKQPWQCFTHSKKFGCKLWCNGIRNCPEVYAKYKQLGGAL